MSKAIGRAAERAAERVSRREALGSLGRAALGAAALGAVLAGIGRDARAGGPGGLPTPHCVNESVYTDMMGYTHGCPPGTRCVMVSGRPSCKRG